MKKQIIAIGGGGFGRNPGKGVIEQYILNQTKKPRHIKLHNYTPFYIVWFKK